MPHKILIVDDEVRIAQTLALILQQKGYETAAAYDGASALALSIGFRPDLVLTDIVMPGMSGIELALAVTEKNPHCRVLLFSGQAGANELWERAQAQGFDLALLSKPVHPVELLKKVAEILNPSELPGMA